MAYANGFRIYVVQVFKNRKKDQEPEDVSQSSEVRDQLLHLLEVLNEAGTQFLEPFSRADTETKRPTTSVTVGEPHVVRDDLIHLTVSVGEHGSHRKATRAGKKAKNLENWSPEIDYFVTFVLPQTSGEEFMVVTQTVRRRDPMGPLFRVLRERGIFEKKKAREAEDAARKQSREQGLPVAKRMSHHRLVFDRRQAIDNGYIDEIMESAKSATAVFKSKIPSDRGADRPVVQRTLQIRLRTENDREIGRSVGKRWSQKLRTGKAATASEGVSELAGLLSEHDLLEEDEADQYTEAAVSVRSEMGISTTIAVDTLRDVFTYPVSDGLPPTLRSYYDKIAPRLETVAAEERIEIGSINSLEVEECLGVSTSVPS